MHNTNGIQKHRTVNGKQGLAACDEKQPMPQLLETDVQAILIEPALLEEGFAT
jgi:hypothetical protein